nr:flagellar basal body L-ring protein FlgH [Desulfobulbaceae bacterium]
MKSLIFTIVTALFMTGCVTKQSAQVSQPFPERHSLPLVERQQDLPAEGAIFSGQSRNIYSDSRAKAIGDIVLIKIVETSSGKKTAETTTSRDSSLKGGISSLFGFESLFAGPDGQHTPSLTSMSTNLQKSFTGTGETKRDSTVTATLSARVIDVTLDGNLIIRGYREVRVNNETQHIVLSGLVRPSDISKDNSIESSHIADARIEYTGTGAIASKQQPGWLANALDIVWPF